MEQNTAPKTVLSVSSFVITKMVGTKGRFGDPDVAAAYSLAQSYGTKSRKGP